MDYVSLKPRRHVASVKPKDASEARHWKTFKAPIYLKAYAAVDSVHFSATEPHRYAVTSGARIQIYSPKTARVVKNITRFKTTARSGHIRHDGKLIIAGDDDGLVQVFDIGSRAILRTMREHKQPVRTTLFSPPTFSSILTTSDDTTVRTYDLATGSQTNLFTSHVDYVRAGAFLPSHPSLCLSGSYDGTVKLWDSRMPEAEFEAMSMTHGYPVESILVHPSGTMAISAGGPLIRVWDLVSGSERCLKALSNHQKTVTCLAWDGQHRRVLSGGLDGLVKVYDAADGAWRVGHTMRYGSQITTLAVSPSDSHLIVGTAEGTVSVRQKQTTAKATAARAEQSAALASGNFQHALAGLSSSSAIHSGLHASQQTYDDPSALKPRRRDDDVEVTFRSKRRKPDKTYDKYLRAYRYGDALDYVLDQQPHIDPNVIYSLMLELAHRDGLQIALANRDDISLAPILKFLLRHCIDPRYSTTICDVIHIVISMYASALGQSPMIDDLFHQLKRKISNEVRFQDELLQLQGSLDMLLVSNASLAG